MGISSRMNRMGIRKKATYPVNTTVFQVDTQYGYTHQFSVTGTNISINWGDGTIEEISSANDVTKSHTYSDEKVYIIQIANTTNFRHSSTNNILVNVLQLGNSITSLYKAFYQSTYIVEIDALNWDLSNCTSLYSAFWSCSSLYSIDASNWDLSSCTTLFSTFRGCVSLKEIKTANWSLDSCTSLEYAFADCGCLEYLDTSNWNLENCNTLHSSFANCISLTNIETSNWNLSNVNTLFTTFYNCKKLAFIDVSNWDLSSCTTMHQTFFSCSSLTNIDASNWDLSSCTTMYQTFFGCSSLTNIGVICWDLSNCSSFHYFCYGCSSLFLDITNMFNSIAMDNITVQRMFYSCKNITGTANADKLWNNANITFTYSTGAFYNCTSLDNYNEIPSSWGGGGA